MNTDASDRRGRTDGNERREPLPDGGVHGTTQEERTDDAGTSRIVAGVLAVVVGGFGAHKFYQGNLTLGILYLVFFWTVIPAVLGLVEGVLMLLADDETYDRKYSNGSFLGR